MKYQNDFILLMIIIFIEIWLLYYVKKRASKRSAVAKYFGYFIICIIGWCAMIEVQVLVINFLPTVSPLFIDYLVYPFVALSPVAMFFVAVSMYSGTEFKMKKKYYLLFIVPFLTMFILWTNQLHFLFYKGYSINIQEAELGPYASVHLLYTYGLFLVDMIILIKNSIKHTGTLSIQTVLITIGLLTPIAFNIMGMTVFDMNIFVTPISLFFTLICMTIAIFKYDFLNITNVALKNIVDQMSDFYIILNRDYQILDCNKPFETAFNVRKNQIVGKNVDELELMDKIRIQSKKIGNYLDNARKTNKLYKVNAKIADENKYYNIEIRGIYERKRCVGILVLFKDITQHISDMEELKLNQNKLMERERLASLGEMIGGIAHNLKTPIMSISGAMEGMSDLIKEYDKSIDDPDVTKEDHHAIAKDMTEWVKKVESYDSYMSDIITAVKGQSVNMNDDSSAIFTIKELLDRTNILMKHELKKSFITLNVVKKISESETLYGNINSLIQVLNNLISNAMQSYNGEPNNVVDLVIDKKDNNIIISVIDHGSGIPKDIQEKLFNKMVTTKGKNGTGLGLFMSYSTIKGHFNGDINFTSKQGVGTTFNVILPCK